MAYKEKLQPINEYEWLLPKAVRKEMKVAGKLIAKPSITQWKMTPYNS